MPDYRNITVGKASHVKNVTRYNIEMRKAMIDKLFFLDKVGDTSVFVDYGCADASIISLASQILPEARFVGMTLSKKWF